MALGTRKNRERQEPLWYAAELPKAPGHPFYRRLNAILDQAKFDGHCEAACAPFYADRLGRPSLPPGQYFRAMMVGFFEGLDSERGIAWRAADSLALREFLAIGLDEAPLDHSTLSRTRRLLGGDVHKAVFDWVLREIGKAGLLKGKTIGVDSTTLEASAAMKSIVRRDTGESYAAYLQRLAEAEGVDPGDPAALRRMDRKRRKKTSNEEWGNPNDPDAQITRMKDGHTALAHKVEIAVDMQTGAILAATAHGGAAADTATVKQTVVEAGLAVAELIDQPATDGKFGVNAGGVEEVVADKGYHSNGVLVALTAELELRTYVAEPERGQRNWEGREAEKEAVYGNRRRINGKRGKGLQRDRGEKVERAFAHQFDTGGMDRLYVRGTENVAKKVLIQAAACNLALLMRSLYGAGKPRAAHDLGSNGIFDVLAFIAALEGLPDRPERPFGLFSVPAHLTTPRPRLARYHCRVPERRGFATGC